ncbi:MAG TPA: bifunctional uridylyltransferase/uridylyl-removing protein, partial [Xanthobacteraceae bacterium]
MLTLTDPAARITVSVFDEEAVARDLAALAASHSGREPELRTAVAQRLKAALTTGRAAAEQLLLKDRHGRRCAERLCGMQDGLIRVLFDFASRHLYRSENPSEAERIAVVATGG